MRREDERAAKRTVKEIRAAALERAATLSEQLTRVLAYIGGTIGGEVSAVLSSAPAKDEGIYICRESGVCGAPFDKFCDLFELGGEYEEREDGLIVRKVKVGNVDFFTIEQEV